MALERRPRMSIPARGVIVGVVLGTAIWVGVALCAWFIWRVL